MPTVSERDLHDVVRRILTANRCCLLLLALTVGGDIRIWEPAQFDAQERMAYDTSVAGTVYRRRAATREPARDELRITPEKF